MHKIVEATAMYSDCKIFHQTKLLKYDQFKYIGPDDVEVKERTNINIVGAITKIIANNK